ncbi:MAG TPA: hypothetical protein VH054_08510, partial [Polyangiaceae bacterium]|nr:hypothetical protein [Polyangiaceae bacterium]
TLPLLVAYFVRKNGNVGKSVGQLYFVNTLGSAFASILSVMVMMGPLGELNTVRAAAAVNAVVGLGALAFYMRERKSPAHSDVSSSPKLAMTEAE